MSDHPLDDPVMAAFVKQQTNRAMRTAFDHELASCLLQRAGLRAQPNRPKSWDHLIGIYQGWLTTPLDTPVLDAGADHASPWAHGLVAVGFSDVLGINLSIKDEPYTYYRVRYQHGDIMNTGLPSASFGYVGSISVIEHGVDLPMFMRESARLLRPGGHLFVSFDYWHEPIDCTGKSAFGLPYTVLSPAHVEEMLDAGREFGLTVAGGEPDLTCGERPIKWLGLEYTFANLLFQKA